MKSRSGVAAGSSLAEMEAGLSAAEAEVNMPYRPLQLLSYMREMWNKL